MGRRLSKEEQLAEPRKIPQRYRMQVSDEILLQLFISVYGTGKTFHRGVAGNWKQYFNEDHKQAFKELLGDFLIGLGYEKDYNW